MSVNDSALCMILDSNRRPLGWEAGVLARTLKSTYAIVSRQDVSEDVLGVTVDEEKTVREGETVTLHTGFTGLQRDVQIQWFYGPVDPDTIIAQILRGEIITDYSDRFRDRLQLDKQTGSLTIRSISITDSGVYKVQIIRGKLSEKKFRVTVYATVPAPHIRVRQNHSAVSGSSGPKRSVECSVENGRDVTLSWYKGKEILNQTSSPDLNTNLSLTLEIEDQDCITYSCVSANLVSNKTTQLNVTDLCNMSGKPAEELNYCEINVPTQNTTQKVTQETAEEPETIYSSVIT
ncbi:uncharacterized protein LOC115823811 [Chanos chanos]|uniref:Uncharacterized protein LOC115823811 n=1 Tax=Chanos chanos TaxID=29144 RepID=A0A6J2WK53_CHACN|nr:uncharacterized protein LOC115823811 [Chanos chanos]